MGAVQVVDNVYVRIVRDEDAGVWIGTGLNLDGLIVEERTLDALDASLKQLIPQMIELNGLPVNGGEAVNADGDDAAHERLWCLPIPSQNIINAQIS